MELVRDGYKVTEVGLIPEDWDYIKIQSLLDDNIIVSHLDGNHGALYPRSSEFTDNGVPYITANDFKNGFVDFSNIRYLPVTRAEQFQKGIAKDGDVLFAHNATVGPTAVMRTNLEYVILSTTATYFRTDNSKLINYYLRYFFESDYFVKQYGAVMRQSTRNQIPITQQRKFSVILPPTLAEQRAIATSLSDVDALISSLDKLIEKKKAIKQGAMQELLTPPNKGGKRLDGFSGEWNNIRLENIYDKIIDNRGKTPPYIVNGDVELIETSSISFVNKNPDYSKISKWVTFETFKNWFRGHPQKNDILISTVGEYSGASAIMKFNRGTVAQNLIAVRLSKIYPLFAFYWTRSNLFKQQLNEVMMGHAQPSLKVTWLIKFIIDYPVSKNEQIALAKILSDMDSEIQELENKKEKYKQIKQGMMQELLTGKTRLV